MHVLIKCSMVQLGRLGYAVKNWVSATFLSFLLGKEVY